MWATCKVVQAAVGNCAAVLHRRGISSSLLLLSLCPWLLLTSLIAPE
jgi:hypothetical protein